MGNSALYVGRVPGRRLPVTIGYDARVKHDNGQVRPVRRVHRRKNAHVGHSAVPAVAQPWRMCWGCSSWYSWYQGTNRHMRT